MPRGGRNGHRLMDNDDDLWDGDTELPAPTGAQPFEVDFNPGARTSGFLGQICKASRKRITIVLLTAGGLVLLMIVIITMATENSVPPAGDAGDGASNDGSKDALTMTTTTETETSTTTVTTTVENQGKDTAEHVTETTTVTETSTSPAPAVNGSDTNYLRNPLDGADNASEPAENRSNIVRPLSATGRRHYRLFRAPSGVQCLAVIDIDASKGAMAVNVGTGSYSDPDQTPGLAHFLEHMLFMGTKEYPGEDEYSKFLAQHAGYSNAYTSGINTNYYFSVDPPFLEEGIKRLSSFFKSANLAESGAAREKQAVASEHQKNQVQDEWRLYQTLQNYATEESRLNSFGTGSTETLSQDDIVDQLRQFYQTHYHASNLHAVAIATADMTLDQLEKIMSDALADVPKQDDTAAKAGFDEYVESDEQNMERDSPPAYKAGVNLGQWINMVPVTSGSRSLHIFWPDLPGSLVEDSSLLLTKFLSSFLANEAEHALPSVLRSASLADEVSFSIDEQTFDMTIVQLNIVLTDTGAQAKSIDLTMALVATYVDLIRDTFKLQNQTDENSDDAQWRWRELERISSTAFNWQLPDKTEVEASNLAAQMQYLKTPTQELFGAPSVHEWKKDSVKEFVDRLTIENTVTVFFNSTDGPYQYPPDTDATVSDVANDDTWSVDKWYSIQSKSIMYDQAGLVDKWRSDAADPELWHKKLRLPQGNPFAPADRMGPSVVDLNAKNVITPFAYPETHYPSGLGPDERVDTRLIYYNNMTNESPIVNFNIHARSTVVADATAEEYMHLRVILNAWAVSDSETYEYARQADFTFEMSSTSSGIQLLFTGPRDRLDMLMVQVVGSLHTYSLPEGDFQNALSILRTNVEDHMYGLGYKVVGHVMRSLLIEGTVPYEQDLAILDKITREDVLTTWDKILTAGFDIDMLSHGNVAESEANLWAVSVRSVFGPPPVVDENSAAPRFDLNRAADMHDDETILYMQALPAIQETNVVSCVYPMGWRLTVSELATLDLLERAVREEFFDVMRTKKQLGYVASAFSVTIYPFSFFQVVIQGDHEPTEVQKDIDQFIEDYLVGGKLFSEDTGLVNEGYEDLVSGYANDLDGLLKLDDQRLSQFWDEIRTGRFEFAMPYELKNAAQHGEDNTLKITGEDIVNDWKDLTKNRKMCVWLLGSGKVPEEDPEGFEHIFGDINEWYQEHRQWYPDPADAF
eukprot:Clim_evm101s153 gene=Clim_evmTU101s153